MNQKAHFGFFYTVQLYFLTLHLFFFAVQFCFLLQFSFLFCMFLLFSFSLWQFSFISVDSSVVVFEHSSIEHRPCGHGYGFGSLV